MFQRSSKKTDDHPFFPRFFFIQFERSLMRAPVSNNRLWKSLSCHRHGICSSGVCTSVYWLFIIKRKYITGNLTQPETQKNTYTHTHKIRGGMKGRKGRKEQGKNRGGEHAKERWQARAKDWPTGRQLSCNRLPASRAAKKHVGAAKEQQRVETDDW
jgi:hypothetical protein